MKTVKKLMNLFTKKQVKSVPIVILKKEVGEGNVKEYKSIDEAIMDLENDTNVPAEKIQKLKLSLQQLKNKTSIKIHNGEVIE